MVQQRILKIVLDTPLDRNFEYLWQGKEGDALPQIGQIAFVPFGVKNEREMAGMIVGVSHESEFEKDKLKSINSLSICPALNAEWLALNTFAAHYYQRPLGEVALPALPKNLRLATSAAQKALSKHAEKWGWIQAVAPDSGATPKTPKKKPNAKAVVTATAIDTDTGVDVGNDTQAHEQDLAITYQLNEEQNQAVTRIFEAYQAHQFTPFVLHGITGSGKTLTYLDSIRRILTCAAEKKEPAQVLIMVPEINLTPQLQQKITEVFPHTPIAILHSQMAEGQRLSHWLAAHAGQAAIILGTRLAVLASIPHLQCIIVDEEHDPSYKQQEGLRYSARDLAIWRAHQLRIPVILGSATPSMETWQQVISGKYQKLALTQRASPNAVLPKIKLIHTAVEKPIEGITPYLIQAIKNRLDKGEQSLLYLNRRGYSPVLCCDACGWVSNCTRCTAHLVWHKTDKRLRCHHCGYECAIPRACQSCGNTDLQPLGRGTQRLEETLAHIFPHARLFRIDADSTRLKGSAEAAFDKVHQGEVDILIGTQMVSKGHDFQNLSLVAALNPDNALFSQDFRASERLFAQLMQVAGRAGRTARKETGNASEVLIQTRYPEHPLYQTLLKQNYAAFAQQTLLEREQAGMPPFMYQTMIRAEARSLDIALEFLRLAKQAAQHLITEHGFNVIMNDAIPMSITRVYNRERAQLLVESPTRKALQHFLPLWIHHIRALKSNQGGLKWHIEVDPFDI